MKIKFFGLEEVEQSYYTKAINNAEISFVKEPLNENNIAEAQGTDVVGIFVNSVINKKIIDALPDLKFIAACSTGVDHIDYKYAQTKAIKTSNVPAYGSHSVAEFTFGLILNISRKLIDANDSIRQSADFRYFPALKGFELMGKTLGVIGTGKIGKNVVKIAKSFEMKVVAYDLYPDLEFAKASAVEYKSLNDALSESDIITLHTPYNKENHHLMNKERISLMKKGAYLINTARGELVDTEALIWGLKEKIIAGAGLDVLEGEDELKLSKDALAVESFNEEQKKMINWNQELMKMPNVIITPHIAFYSSEAVAEIHRVTALNINGFLSGSETNLVS